MMGHSGGRSAKNPNGDGSAYRATPRQRELVDAPRAPEEGASAAVPRWLVALACVGSGLAGVSAGALGAFWFFT